MSADEYGLTWCNVCDVPVAISYVFQHEREPYHVRLQADNERVQKELEEKDAAPPLVPLTVHNRAARRRTGKGPLHRERGYWG